MTKPFNPITVTSSGGITVSLSKLLANKSETKMSTQQSNTNQPIKNWPPVEKGDQSSSKSETTNGDEDADTDDEDLSSLEDLSDGDNENLESVDEEQPASQQESLDEQEIDSGVLEIFHEKCLRCAHLVPHETKKFNSCHFSKGNARCPASSVQILIGIPLDAIVNAFMTAEVIGDNAKLGRLYAQLAEKPEWQQQRIQEALTARRNSNLKIK